jgi:hypothetical protein
MKRILWIIGVILILILDWLALDDITTGNEPDFRVEYLILGVSVVIIGILIWKRFVRKR